MRFVIHLVLSAYEREIQYEKTFFVCKVNGLWSITQQPEKIFLFDSVKEAEEVLILFKGLDFSYAQINTEDNWKCIKDFTNFRLTK